MLVTARQHLDRALVALLRGATQPPLALRLAAAEEPAVAERAAERELGGLELLRRRLAPERLGAAEVAVDALAVDELDPADGE